MNHMILHSAKGLPSELRLFSTHLKNGIEIRFTPDTGWVIVNLPLMDPEQYREVYNEAVEIVNEINGKEYP